MSYQIKSSDYNSPNLFDWCANCGNYGINTAVKRALASLDITPQKILMCFDIGCNGNGADKIAGYTFHGLHGRVIPLATGAYLANKRLSVLAFAGDGATLDEGIGHLIHALRSNYNITFLLHNNNAFSLTTGQATPTSALNYPMNSAINGVPEDPISIMNLVFSINPSFVARGYSGHIDQLTDIIKAGLQHPGFSFIEILQDCPTYNKIFSHEWYLERIFDVKNLHSYCNNNLEMAKQVAQGFLSIKSLRQTKNAKSIATGVLYQNKKAMTYNERLQNRQSYITELVDEVKPFPINKLLDAFR